MDNEDTSSVNEKTRQRVPKSLVSFFGVLISGLALAGLLMLTSPDDGPTTIVVTLACLFLLSFSVISIAVKRLVWIFNKEDVKTIQTFYISLLFSTGIVFLIGLQTLGQLQISDVILTAVFIVLLGFYILRRL